MTTIRAEVRRALDRALEGHPTSLAEATLLASVRGPELAALVAAADELRRRQVGQRVTWVANRNINFTNVCTRRCGFCAFSRGSEAPDAFRLSTEEVVRLAGEAEALGATEVCLQAGLAPDLDAEAYLSLVRALKARHPRLHLHAFSPEEILQGARLSNRTVEDLLRALKDEGLDSLPGTSAEVLDQELRDRISPGRIGVDHWVEVVTTAHRLELPTTATMMYGFLEEPRHVATHLLLLRSLQEQTGGFTEMVPLSFVHPLTPAWRSAGIPGLRPGATGAEVLAVHALARVVLGPTFRNIQASWVKEGPRLAQVLLDAGANDLGGTLLDESISTSAGSGHGQFLPPRELVQLIRDAGRLPARRDTLYGILAEGEEDTPLDRVQIRPGTRPNDRDSGRGRAPETAKASPGRNPTD